MKKFYFLFLFALIASIGNLYAAEVVLWEEDFSSGKLTGYVVGNGGGTTKIISEKLAKGTAPELLIAKKGGYLQVTVSDLKGLSGKMTLTFKSNKTDAKFANVTTSTTGVTVSKPTNSSGVWTADFTVSEGVTSLTFKVENSDNAKKAQNGRYDDFKLVGYEAETKCATPTFNLTADATYTDAQTLEITSTTADATIHYTVNGGEEKIGQPAEFTENGKYTVDAWATKDGLTDSEHASITFTIAKKMNKPTFNLTEGAVYGEAKVLEITSDKVGAQIEYTVVGGGNISITKTEASPVSVTLDQNGGYTVEAFALEMDDYAKSDAAELNFKIELAAGVPTFSVEEGTYSEAQAIELKAGEGGEKVFYTINDGTEQQYIEPIKLEEEGIYKIAAYTAATETLAKSASVTKTYIISLPLEEPYILCEDAAWLTEGTKIIFVGEKNNKYYGLSGDADGVFLTGGLVTISAKELTEKDVTVKVFVVGRTANGVTFNTAAGYLAADKTASKGNLSYAAGNEGDCFHWTVSVANGEATVVNADVTGDCNNLQFNPSAKTPRFGAYADSYKNGNLSIYLLGSTSSVSSMSAEGVKVFAAEGGVKVVAAEATDVAVYTVAGQLVRQARVAEGSTLVNVAPGFYVVRANGTATKVIVR